MKFIAILAVVLLVGCTVKYVPIPDHLTRLCLEHEKKDDTLDEAVRLANSRLDSVKECNGRLTKISNIQGTEVEEDQ